MFQFNNKDIFLNIIGIDINGKLLHIFIIIITILYGLSVTLQIVGGRALPYMDNDASHVSSFVQIR